MGMKAFRNANRSYHWHARTGPYQAQDFRRLDFQSIPNRTDGILSEVTVLHVLGRQPKPITSVGSDADDIVQALLFVCSGSESVHATTPAITDSYLL